MAIYQFNHYVPAQSNFVCFTDKGNSTHTVTLLVHSNADGAMPLYAAAYNGLTETVKVLLSDSNTDVNASRNDDGATPLYAAAYHGHAEIVKLLLDHNADVNARCHTGDTALDIAAQKGHSKIVKLLTHNKADVVPSCTHVERQRRLPQAKVTKSATSGQRGTDAKSSSATSKVDIGQKAH